MKKLGVFAALMLGVSALLTATVASAQDEAKPKKQYSEKQLAQQQRMTDCSADAKQRSLKGDDRKAFMKTCLSGGQVSIEVGFETATAPENGQGAGQREKMKACNASAKEQALKGADRKTFMSNCLAN